MAGADEGWRAGMAHLKREGVARLLVMAIGVTSPCWLALAALAQAPSSEQTAGRPGIRVAPVILAEPEVETSVSIEVGPESTIPRQTFLRVRGLPSAAKLTEGHMVSPGVWAVPLGALPALRLLAPLSSSGRTEIHLSLVAMDGGILAETRSSLVVAPAWLLGTGRQDITKTVPQTRPQAPMPEVATPNPPAPIAPAVVTAPARPQPPTEPRTIPAIVDPPRTATPAPGPAAAAPPASQPAARTEPQAPVVAALPPAAAQPKTAPALQALPPVTAPPTQSAQVLSSADRARAELMLKRGDEFWRQGNFAAARQFFRRAADIGLAAGAIRMGASYDPIELRSMSVVGINPDPKEAAFWYEKAHELGAPEATARLSRLQPR